MCNILIENVTIMFIVSNEYGFCLIVHSVIQKIVIQVVITVFMSYFMTDNKIKQLRFVLLRCVRSDLLWDGVYQAVWSNPGSLTHPDFIVYRVETLSVDALPSNTFHSVASFQNVPCCAKSLLLSKLLHIKDFGKSRLRKRE